MENYDLLDRDKIEEAYDILVTATRGNADIAHLTLFTLLSSYEELLSNVEEAISYLDEVLK